MLSWNKIKDYNVMIDARNIFDQPNKNNLKTYDSIRKIVARQGDDYTIGGFLDNPYFKKQYKFNKFNRFKQTTNIRC